MERIKCLDCGVTVAPEGKWEQCECGHLYVDATTEPARVGFLSEDAVEYVTDGESKSQTRRKKVQRSGDKWAESGTFE